MEIVKDEHIPTMVNSANSAKVILHNFSADNIPKEPKRPPGHEGITKRTQLLEADRYTTLDKDHKNYSISLSVGEVEGVINDISLTKQDRHNQAPAPSDN